MPIDTSIYSLQRPVGINTPFENLSQVLALKNQQENLQSQAVLRQAEAQRQAGEAQKLQQQQSDQAAVDQAMAGAGGDFDKAISTLQQRGAGHLVPVLQKIQEQAQTAQKLHEGVLDAQNQYAAHLASSVLSWKDADKPDGGQADMMNALQGAKVIAQQHGYDVSPILQAIQQDPSSLEKRMNAVIALAQGPQKAENVPQGGTLVTPGPGTAPARVNFQAPTKPEVPTEASLDAQYQGILQKLALKQPLTQAEQAAKTSYEQRKLLGPEAAAANAANQQARSIAAQTAQQARTQDFAEQQAGRSELTNKVEQPYLDAKEKASTLRSVIDAARNGNMVAGNVQTLLGTLGLVTMEGVKRINTTELQSVSGAGSLLERLKGEVGGLTAGKPLSQKIQDDLQQLSDSLEQSATQKYQQGWQATTKRYKLNDEQPLVPLTAAPATAPAVQPPATGGRIRVKGPNGESGTVPDDGKPLPTGWVKAGG